MISSTFSAICLQEAIDLEKLFKRTETQPMLYWLPMTQEQAEARAATKAAKEASVAQKAKDSSPALVRGKSDQVRSSMHIKEIHSRSERRK